MHYSIVGGGLAGCVLASLIPDSILYEKDDFIGGLCKDNENYQDFVHILHTDNKKVWDLVAEHTTIRPHRTLLKSYVGGELRQHPPKELTPEVLETQYKGYSKKMWGKTTPPEALQRIVTSEDGFMFKDKYEGVPDFARLFSSLTKDTLVVRRAHLKDGDLYGKIILTGPIDEYFNYCYGELPYRGMQAVHYESEIGLDADFITFSDEKIPFQRLIDYSRLGYKGTWIGVESACKAKHYPMLDDQSGETYQRYLDLAKSKGIILCGRLATYRYLDMDEVIEQAMEIADDIRNLCS